MTEAEQVSFFDKKSKEIEALKECDPELCRRKIVDFEEECRSKDLYLPLPFLVDYLISLYSSEGRLTDDGEYTLLGHEQRSALYHSFLEGVRFADKHEWMSHEWPDGWNEYVRPKLVNLVADISEFRPEQAEKLRQNLGQIADAEQQRLGDYFRAGRPEAVMLLLLRARTLVSLSDEEDDVLHAFQPVAELWLKYIRVESKGSSPLSKASIEKLSRCIQLLNSMIDISPRRCLCSIALGQIVGFCCLFRAQLNLSLGESENVELDCDTYLAAFSECPNAGLLAVECFSQLGHDDRAREIFAAIDLEKLDDSERDDYRWLEEYLMRNPAGKQVQGSRNRWSHILYFVLATITVMFVLSLLTGR